MGRRSVYTDNCRASQQCRGQFILSESFTTGCIGVDVSLSFPRFTKVRRLDMGKEIELDESSKSVEWDSNVLLDFKSFLVTLCAFGTRAIGIAIVANSTTDCADAWSIAKLHSRHRKARTIKLRGVVAREAESSKGLFTFVFNIYHEAMRLNLKLIPLFILMEFNEKVDLRETFHSVI